MARIAALGVSIDSSGAKKGAGEVRSELQGIAGSAERATAAVKRTETELNTAGRAANLSAKEAAKYADELRKMERSGQNLTVAEARWLAQHQASTRSIQQQGAALGQLTNRDMAQAVQRYDAMTAAMQRQQEASGRTQAQMQALGRAHAQALAMDAQMSRSFIATAGSSGRLRESLSTLAIQATGAVPAFGGLANAVGSLAMGSAVTAAVLAGAAAIGFAYKTLTEETRKAKEEQEKATDALRKWYETTRLGKDAAEMQSAKMRAEAVERLRREIEHLRRVESGEAGESGLSDDANRAMAAAAAARRAAKEKELAQLEVMEREYNRGRVRSEDETNTSVLARQASTLVAMRTHYGDRADIVQRWEETSKQIALAIDLYQRQLLAASTEEEKQRIEALIASALSAKATLENASRVTSADRRFDRGEEEIARMRMQVDRQLALNAAMLQGADAVAKVTAELDKKAELAEIDARATGANATLTLRQAAALKQLVKEKHDAAEASKELSEALDLQARFTASLESTQRALADAERESARRLREGASARAEEITIIREQVEALSVGREAYELIMSAQVQNAAVVAATAAANRELTDDEVDAIRGQILELERLKKLREALLRLDGKNPFKIPAAEANNMADHLARAMIATQGLASAFGDVGNSIARAVSQAVQLATHMQNAQRLAEEAARAQGTPREGAARTAAQGANLAAGASFLMASAGVIKYWHDSIRASSDAARQAAKALLELRIAVKKQVEDFVIQASGSPLDRELAGIEARFKSIIHDLLQAGAPRVDRLGDRFAVNKTPTAEDVNAVIDAYERMIADAKRAAELAAKHASMDLDARMAAAQSRTAEADAIRQAIANEKELEEARLAGADAAVIAKLKEVQAAEAAARAAAIAQQRAEFGLSLQARRQALSGDDRGAMQTRLGIDAARELSEAEKLLNAGVITSEQFAELARILDEELNKALEDYDAALAKQKQQIMDDLAVRALVAQGKDAEAAQLRREIANRQELEGVTDQAIIDQIKYVQGLEEEARIKDEARAAAERIARQEMDILRRTIAAYQVLDPVMAEELERSRIEIERAEELANAENEMIRQRLIELHLLEDQAAAARKLAEEQQELIRAAERLANITATVEEEFLRATGKGFDADVKALERWRDERIREAREAGASQDVIDMILATFDAKYKALIESTMQVAEAVVEEAKREANRFLTGRVTASNIAAVSEVTMQTAASTWAQWTQYFAVLPMIERNTAALAGGRMTVNGANTGALVQVTQHFYGDTNGFSAEDLAALMADNNSALVKSVDRAFGELGQRKDRLAGLPVR